MSARPLSAAATAVARRVGEEGNGDWVGGVAKLGRAAGAKTKKMEAAAAALSITTAGARRREPDQRMKRGNDSRAGSVTRGAMGSTMPRWVRGSATGGRARRAAAA